MLAVLSCASFDCNAGSARGTLTVTATLLAPTCLEAPAYKDCVPHVESRRQVTSYVVAAGGDAAGDSGLARVVERSATIVTISY